MMYNLILSIDLSANESHIRLSYQVIYVGWKEVPQGMQRQETALKKFLMS